MIIRGSEELAIKDMSLADYIGVKGKYAKYLPHTAGRYQKKRFRKAQVSLPYILSSVCTSCFLALVP